MINKNQSIVIYIHKVQNHIFCLFTDSVFVVLPHPRAILSHRITICGQSGGRTSTTNEKQPPVGEESSCVSYIMRYAL